MAEEFAEEVAESPTEPLQEQQQEAIQEAMLEQNAGVSEPAEVEDQQQIPQGGQQKGGGQQQQQQMPKTGGIELGSLLLPTVALLAGSGILVAYGIRRRRN